MNQQLLLRIAEKIRESPHRHAQGHWCKKLAEPCGTAFCIAGWAITLGESCASPLFNEYGMVRAWTVWDGENVILKHVGETPELAQEELDICSDDAGVLFDTKWEPRRGLTVPEALEAYAHGATLEEVTDPDY